VEAPCVHGATARAHGRYRRAAGYRGPGQRPARRVSLQRRRSSEIVDGNLRARQSEVSKADQIIAEGIATVGEERRTWPPSTSSSSTASPPRKCASASSSGPWPRSRAATIPQQVVAQLARGITNKLIHAPTTGLKKASAEGRHDILGHAVRLLGLPVDALEAGGPAASASDAAAGPKGDGEATRKATEATTDRATGKPGVGQPAAQRQGRRIGAAVNGSARCPPPAPTPRLPRLPPAAKSPRFRRSPRCSEGLTAARSLRRSASVTRRSPRCSVTPRSSPTRSSSAACPANTPSSKPWSRCFAEYRQRTRISPRPRPCSGTTTRDARDGARASSSEGRERREVLEQELQLLLLPRDPARWQQRVPRGARRHRR
jgi:hypothetical protein